MPKLTPDKKWKRFNEKLIELMKANDFFGLGITYYEMANFLDKEGKDSSHCRKMGYKMKLRCQKEDLNRLKELGVSNVEILADIESSCDYCKKLNGNIFSLAEALKTNPLPVKECEHKYGCRCTYK